MGSLCSNQASRHGGYLVEKAWSRSLWRRASATRPQAPYDSAPILRARIHVRQRERQSAQTGRIRQRSASVLG